MNDNWIEWAGGDCPVPSNEAVIVLWRSGNEFIGDAWGFQWHHASEPRGWDVIGYRIAGKRGTRLTHTKEGMDG